MIILGINCDNDSAFINDTLNLYCEQTGIVFTHSRVHHSNDQAWIEQKNGAVIRKIVGHERFSGIVAGQALAQLFQAVRLYVNYFQPSFKLRYKIREGAKAKKWYNSPATPCDRTYGAQLNTTPSAHLKPTFHFHEIVQQGSLKSEGFSAL